MRIKVIKDSSIEEIKSIWWMSRSCHIWNNRIWDVLLWLPERKGDKWAATLQLYDKYPNPDWTHEPHKIIYQWRKYDLWVSPSQNWRLVPFVEKWSWLWQAWSNPSINKNFWDIYRDSHSIANFSYRVLKEVVWDQNIMTHWEFLSNTNTAPYVIESIEAIITWIVNSWNYDKLWQIFPYYIYQWNRIPFLWLRNSKLTYSNWKSNFEIDISDIAQSIISFNSWLSDMVKANMSWTEFRDSLNWNSWIMICNQLNLLLDWIVESQLNWTDNVNHIAWKDMWTYVEKSDFKDLFIEILRYYNQWCESNRVRSKLPNSFNVIVSKPLRIISPYKNTSWSIETLYKLLNHQSRIWNEIWNLYKSWRRNEAQTLENQRHLIRDKIKSVLTNLWEKFDHSYIRGIINPSSSYPTHYDVFNSMAQWVNPSERRPEDSIKFSTHEKINKFLMKNIR